MFCHKKSKQTEPQQRPSGSWRRADPHQQTPRRPHAGRAGHSVSPSTSSWAVRCCEGSTEQLQVRNAHESGSPAEADISTVKESSCMLGPPKLATKPRTGSRTGEFDKYTIHDPFEASNVDFSRRAMDTVADGLWYFVTSRLCEKCQSDKQFVERYISSEQDDSRYFHVSAVDYQKLNTEGSPESQDILKTVQQCGRPDAYNLLRICRNEGLGQGLGASALNALESLFRERNEMAHGNHLSVNSVSRKKENVSQVIENGCTLLQAVTQWASRRPDGLAKIERSFDSLIGIQSTFQEFIKYRSRRTWVEKTRAKGLTDDATVIEMGINTLKHALDVLENPDSSNRMEWAQWAVNSIACRERGLELKGRMSPDQQFSYELLKNGKGKDDTWLPLGDLDDSDGAFAESPTDWAKGMNYMKMVLNKACIELSTITYT